MYVFVTGSREATPGIHGAFMHGVLSERCSPHNQQIVHGDARGVDRMAASMLPWFGCLAVPANWQMYAKAAGSFRNEALVDMAMTLRTLGHPVSWFAFPLGLSVGTRGCIKLAKEANFEVSSYELLVTPY